MQTAQQGLMEFYTSNQKVYQSLFAFASRPEIVQQFIESYRDQNQWLAFVRPFGKQVTNESIVLPDAVSGASIVTNAPIGLLGAIVEIKIVPGICIWQQNSIPGQLELIYSCGDIMNSNTKHLLYNGYNHFDALL